MESTNAAEIRKKRHRTPKIRKFRRKKRKKLPKTEFLEKRRPSDVPATFQRRSSDVSATFQRRFSDVLAVFFPKFPFSGIFCVLFPAFRNFSWISAALVLCICILSIFGHFLRFLSVLVEFAHFGARWLAVDRLRLFQ